MADHSLYDLMSTQRAIRRLRPDAIADDVLGRILDAATWAPTGGNVQPWRMMLVRDSAKKSALAELYRPRWEKFTQGYMKRFENLPAAEIRKQEKILKAGDYLSEHFHEAPAIFIVCFNPNLLAVTDIRQDRVSVVGGGSIYPAVQNLMLACRAEGVGTVLTTLLCQEEPKVKKLLGMPEDWFTAAAIPIGYPVGGGYGSITRRPAAQLFYGDTWKNPIH